MGAKPQCPFLVLGQFLIGDDFALRIGLINCEASGCRMETIETIAGGDPKRSIVIDQKTAHDVVAQTVWIRRIVKQRLEFSRALVKTEQPVVISSNPEIAGTVLANREPIGTDCWSVPPAIESVVPVLAVDTVECSGRSDPQDSLTILVDCADKGFRRSIRTGETKNPFKRQRFGREMGVPHPTQPSPDAPFTIREYVLDIVLGEAVRISRVIAVTNESLLLAVKLEEASAVCGKPQSAFPVFGHSHDDRQGRGGGLRLVKGIVG